MRWLIPALVVAAVSLADAPLSPAQTAAPSAELRVEALGVSLERIQRELQAPPPTPIRDELNRPRFRLTVQGEWLIGLPPWVATQPDAVAPWVKPNMPLSHFEYLRMTTPDEFRAGTLYPMGPRLDPGGLWQGIRQSFRAGTAKKTREQIEEELRQIDALSRKPPPR